MLDFKRHKKPKVPDPGKPFAYFQWNEGWGTWEQVIDEAAGMRGVVIAYHKAEVERLRAVLRKAEKHLLQFDLKSSTTTLAAIRAALKPSK